MTTRATKCTFEEIMPFKSIPYWLYWPAIGILWFIIGEVLARSLVDIYFFWSRLLFAGAICLVPTVNIWLFYSFRETMKTLSPLLWDDHIEFEKWLEIQEIHIFTLHSWPAKIVTGFITSAALITIITLGLPLKSGIHLVVAYTFFFFLSMFCGQCLFISIGLLLKLKEIVDRPIKVPFFLLPHPGISRLQNFYSATTLIIVSFYTGFVIAVWLGPYGFNLAMLVWLTALSGYPLAMFSWSFFQIHFLLQNVKQSHLKIANNEVQQALKNVLTDHSLKETDRLEKMMSIQNKVKAMKEWPIAVEGALTFLTALVVAIVQALIYVLEVITDAKP